jgi:hypothetical protein
MPEYPERLDVQIRKARARRQAVQMGIPLALMVAGMLVYSAMTATGWHWWYAPLTLLAVIFVFWLTRLEAEILEQTTRWFWRPPR